MKLLLPCADGRLDTYVLVHDTASYADVPKTPFNPELAVHRMRQFLHVHAEVAA